MFFSHTLIISYGFFRCNVCFITVPAISQTFPLLSTIGLKVGDRVVVKGGFSLLEAYNVQCATGIGAGSTIIRYLY